MLEQLRFWWRKSKRKPGRKLTIANYKQPAYLYQKQYRPPHYLHFWDALLQPYDLNLFLALFYVLMLIFIAFSSSPIFFDPHWHPRIDFNRDGAFTITDVLHWFRWFYFVPGDIVISALLQFEGAARFFEVSQHSYGGGGAFMMSLIYWWMMGGINLLFLLLIPLLMQTYLK